jgi:hypothetical protein
MAGDWCVEGKESKKKDKTRANSCKIIARASSSKIKGSTEAIAKGRKGSR